MNTNSVKKCFFKPKGPIITEKTPILPRGKLDISTIPQLMDFRVKETPYKIAYIDSKECVTWKEFVHRADSIAMSINYLKMKKNTTIGVLGQTTGEWGIIDQAILRSGNICVGIYCTLTPSQIAYILNDAEIKILFVSSQNELNLARKAIKQGKKVEYLIAWGDAENEEDVINYSDFLKDGKLLLEKYPQTIVDLKASCKPDDTALLIYTSGTTGESKGAMLSHWNCVFEIRTGQHLYPPDISENHTVSFLPMAHVGEHVMGFYGRINTGMSTYFVGSLDSQKILSALSEQKPTIFGSVPRIFQKAYAKIQSRVNESSSIRKSIFTWAEKQGREMSRCKQSKITPTLKLRIFYVISDRLVFKRIREAFGGQVKWFISGAAPIDPNVLEFFNGAGLLVLEGYGLTEATGLSSVNRLKDYRFGTVGLPMPGTELCIAEDGEVLVRGPNVFKGYFNKPEARAEIVDEEGWLHTGDIGEIVDDRWLRITDRKKNIIITEGGKNLAPARIEALLAAETILGPVLIIGDGKHYLTALITLEREESNIIVGTQDATIKTLCTHSKIVEKVKIAIEKANTELARYEKIRRFLILDQEFTIEKEELTPTLKVKKRVLLKNYAKQIESLYEEPLAKNVIEVYSKS